MKIALFLGAGASVPYDKPTTVSLKEKLSAKYHGNNIITQLLEYQKFPDIEYVLSTIKQFRDFSTTLGGEFCRSYVGNFQGYVKEFTEILDLIENDVFENYSWDHKFDDTLSKIIKPIFDLIASKSSSITVFTTNYDRSIEEFCSRDDNGYHCIDGFKLHEDSGRYLWNGGNYSYADHIVDKTKVFLYKLHGSLNWKKHEKYGIERTTFERKPNDPHYQEDFLIYPTLSPKDEVNGREPYKTILRKFDELIEQFDVCIVIGFSFRDEHIADVLSKFYRAGKGVIVLSPNAAVDFYKHVLKSSRDIQSDPTRKIISVGNTHFIHEKLSTDNIDKIMDMVKQDLSYTRIKKEKH